MRIMRVFKFLLTGMLICAGVVALLWYAGVDFFPPPEPTDSSNSLNIGKNSKIAGQINIPINPRQNFNFKKRDEILAFRRAAVAKFPDLLKSPYVPTPAVFDRMEDGKPWWGEAGLFYFSSGKKSISGRSERSAIVLNPFMLVDCYSTFVPFVNVSGLHSDELFAARTYSDFLYFPQVSNLTWDPSKSYAEVTYDFTSFGDYISFRSGEEFSAAYMALDFRMINARDWGFRYACIALPESRNLAYHNLDSIRELKRGLKRRYQGRAHPDINKVLKLRDFFHTGTSCGYKGGCTNHARFGLEISEICVTQLPALAHIKLWRNNPATPQDKPDFTFDIKFK